MLADQSKPNHGSAAQEVDYHKVPAQEGVGESSKIVVLKHEASKFGFWVGFLRAFGVFVFIVVMLSVTIPYVFLAFYPSQDQCLVVTTGNDIQVIDANGNELTTFDSSSSVDSLIADGSDVYTLGSIGSDDTAVVAWSPSQHHGTHGVEGTELATYTHFSRYSSDSRYISYDQQSGTIDICTLCTYSPGTSCGGWHKLSIGSLTVATYDFPLSGSECNDFKDVERGNDGRFVGVTSTGDLYDIEGDAFLFNVFHALDIENPAVLAMTSNLKASYELTGFYYILYTEGELTSLQTPKTMNLLRVTVTGTVTIVSSDNDIAQGTDGDVIYFEEDYNAKLYVVSMYETTTSNTVRTVTKFSASVLDDYITSDSTVTTTKDKYRTGDMVGAVVVDECFQGTKYAYATQTTLTVLVTLFTILILYLLTVNRRFTTGTKWFSWLWILSGYMAFELILYLVVLL